MEMSPPGLSLLAQLWDDRAMLRRLLGLLVPFVGSAAAVYLSTLLFDRPFFDNAIQLTATTNQTKAQTIAIVTVIFGLVNLLVKPIVRFVTFPIRILTFGLFSLVINGAMLFLTGVIASKVNAPFHVALTWWVIAAALFIGIVSGILSWFGDKITTPGAPRPVAPPPPPPPPPAQYQQPSRYGPQYGGGSSYGGQQYGGGQQSGGSPYGSGQPRR
jgi:putative membrane protein